MMTMEEEDEEEEEVVDEADEYDSELRRQGQSER